MVCLQEMPTASHALLQEAGVSLLGILRDEGFYIEKRRFTAPLKKRQRDSFGTAAPLEMPTKGEIRGYSEG